MTNIQASATELFRAAQSGKVKLVIPTSTVRETVYVQESIYHLGAETIGPKLISLLSLPNVESPDFRWIVEALQFYRTKKSHFGDALLCAFAHAEKYELATFDKGLTGKFQEVVARTPAELLAGKSPSWT